MVTVTFEPNKPGDRISTGLDPVAGKPNTFYAPDFDVLYDCPVLICSQEILRFEVVRRGAEGLATGTPLIMLAGITAGAIALLPFAAAVALRINLR